MLRTVGGLSEQIVHYWKTGNSKKDIHMQVFESNRPCASHHWRLKWRWEIPHNPGVTDTNSREPYIFEPQWKALLTVMSSDFTRKDLDQHWIPSLLLSLEASISMWLAKERSWFMVRQRSSRNWTYSHGWPWKLIDGRVQWSFWKKRVRQS